MTSQVADSLLRPFALRLALLQQWRTFMADEATFAERLWTELFVASELDAELFRFRAARAAAAEARARRLEVTPLARHLARFEMAHSHGVDDWPALEEAARGAPYPWSAFVDHAEDLARARRLRQRLFQ